MDHDTQYLSDHFQNQLKYWGIRPSLSFIEQPQTHGEAEDLLGNAITDGEITRMIFKVGKGPKFASWGSSGWAEKQRAGGKPCPSACSSVQEIKSFLRRGLSFGWGDRIYHDPLKWKSRILSGTMI